MIRINHIAIATQNLYEAAFRLREETGFGFYDGGWSEAGVGSKIVPLGEGSYLQISSVVDVFKLKDKSNTGAQRLYDSAAAGDRFESLNLRVDTLPELERIGKIHGMQPNRNNRGGRIRPDGEHVGAVGLTGGKGLPAGMPAVYFFPDITSHPSGQPVEPAYGLVKPLGIAWVEIGGNQSDLSTWLGENPNLPLRFNGKAAGVYALAVKTAKGEVTIQRKPSAE